MQQSPDRDKHPVKQKPSGSNNIHFQFQQPDSHSQWRYSISKAAAHKFCNGKSPESNDGSQIPYHHNHPEIIKTSHTASEQ
jgi:hypothetical protein